VSREVVLEAAGGLRRHYTRVDWSATPVGPMSDWSPALCNAADLVLNTNFPVTLLWGPEFVLIYNEAFVELIADKHPEALGTPARDVFPEAWAAIGPMMEGVLAGDGATWLQDAPVPLRRHGFLEEAYFTFSYSPVRGADGTVEGVLDIATETTRQVIDRRRLEMLNSLQHLLGDIDHAEQVAERVLPLLRANAADFPAVHIDVAPAAGPAGVGTDGWARFTLGSLPAPRGRPELAVRLSDRLAPDEGYLAFLRVTGSLLGRAIDRINVHEAERDIAEALQRSLLTEPLQPDHLQIAVRYVPAAAEAEIGGDWYDSFIGPDGTLTLVVGDVTGHDRWAAATMAQLRNLVRGVTYARRTSPAGILASLDQAMHGLAVGGYATAIVAHMERDQVAAETGLRTLRWCNAGHPPPVLVAPDGRATLLEERADLLLGLGDGARADHTVTLAPGSSIVFYTDGLVERRGAPLGARLEWLTGILAGCGRLEADEICDRLLSHLDDSVEDDVALLVVRLFPEDEPPPDKSDSGGPPAP
jgi:Stage II sporulation protein E (SpoIIE)/PAS fold